MYPASRRSPGVHHALGERRIDLLERESGPPGDDKVTKNQEFGALMPRLDGQEGIGAEQTEERIGELELAAQALQSIKSVVGLSVG